MADEVYQNNIYKDGAKFVSFRKVAFDMGFNGKSNDKLQMVSFHSVSKGFLGECGLRGGYFELHGIPLEVKQQLYKMASVSLCSNVVGQLMAGLMVNPPKEGDESHPLYIKERDTISESLKRRAKHVSRCLNSLEGMSCNNSDGAMYAFPRIYLPQRFIDHARTVGIPPDTLYCMQLLENTGNVVVPGSGFGQEAGTWHFRTTFLPPESKMDAVMERLAVFHTDFMEKWK